MEYIISIRIPFSETISKILKREKDRFVSEYGSGYKSEPHITLYLGRYTKRGFPKLIQDLQAISLKSFSVSLLKPRVKTEKGLRRKLFFVGLSGKRRLHALHAEVLKIAARHRSALLRRKDQRRIKEGSYGKLELKNLSLYGYAHAGRLFEPHITLGEVAIDDRRPVLMHVQKDLRHVIGKKINISSLIAVFYGKRGEMKKATLFEEARIRLL